MRLKVLNKDPCPLKIDLHRGILIMNPVLNSVIINEYYWMDVFIFDLFNQFSIVLFRYVHMFPWASSIFEKHYTFLWLGLVLSYLSILKICKIFLSRWTFTVSRSFVCVLYFKKYFYWNIGIYDKYLGVVFLYLLNGCKYRIYLTKLTVGRTTPEWIFCQRYAPLSIYTIDQILVPNGGVFNSK